METLVLRALLSYINKLINVIYIVCDYDSVADSSLGVETLLAVPLKI